jgi:thioredoxin reductase (NADPH)
LLPLPPDVDAAHVFPVLTDAQVSRVTAVATERAFADGEAVWDAGDRRRSMFVVLDGEIEVLTGGDQLVVVHGRGQFSGDVDLLSGRPVVVRARARGVTRTLEVASDRLRALVQTDPDLSAVLLRAFLLRRFALMRSGAGNVMLIGSRHSRGTLELQEFLTRNNQPFQSVDVERDADVQKTLDTFEVGVDDVPVLICRGSLVLKRPSIEEVARCLGLDEVNEAVVRDLVVIGAGPAGLAAAVYAASEGLDVLVVESSAPGGQAGTSSRIENYLGFPTGISGYDLASRALVQAEKFGAELAVARTAVRLGCERRPFRVDVGAGAAVQARAVVIATGVRYRRLGVPDLHRFEGVGVYYAATRVEADSCAGEDVVVVGGGNSAGQAAVFLAGEGRRVHMLVRSDGLSSTMSRYLIRRIEETPSITLRTRCEIVGLEGNGKLERVTWREADGGTTTHPIAHVFSMTGAEPNTAWLAQCVALDEKGFVRTGADLTPDDLAAAAWPLARAPLLFETSVAGVFAVGDVRAGSVKRVAAAVGEGSVCVQLVHRTLAGAV